MEGMFLSDKEKLAKIIGFYGVSFAELSRKLGLKNQELYMLNSGKQRCFSRKNLDKIIKNCPEISPYWLITGEGSMLAGSVGIHQTASGSNSGIIVQQSGQDNTYSNQTAASADGIIASQQQTIERLAKQNEQQAEQINRLHGMIESLINKQLTQ